MDKSKLAISLVTLLVIGCATINSIRKTDSFEGTSKAYLRAIRWSDFQAANSFRKVAGTEEDSPGLKEFVPVRVTSCEVTQRVLLKDITEVRQTVQIKYYRTDSVLLRTLIDHQLWEYDAEENSWYLRSGLPHFQ